jgi:ATP-binding cassette subfamily D (ALD) long-chain fatty acid import protein
MYTALSAQLSGSLRHTHSRVVEFAEEIAFLGGEETEKMLVEREYASVVKHENRVLRRRWWFGCVEEGVIKWLWGSFGVGDSVLPWSMIDFFLACSLCHPGFLQAPRYRSR